MVFDGTDTHYIEKLPSSATLDSSHYLLNHKHLLQRNLSCGYEGQHHPALQLFKDQEFVKGMRVSPSVLNWIQLNPP